ncbi:hypothetical protein V474_03105 [Novosphingobium barchaimii LL02]|uniref:DUF4440 domain-containing protein n=1 Tax=Novosphingobium barchaimii LL02 TaxID=1114963 RepID=A0A0J7XJ77_9SPHN|nr:nuclear transport factor 2 family protein [Novosphingobium barchaimii]KMS52056.1 hypothetical protein V474_03105 [Novosphingobium barchaimii LL02]
MSVDIRPAILEMEQRRCAAMLSNDTRMLEQLLDTRLRFHHATGAVDDKPAYLTKMAAGRIAYVSISWTEEVVTELGKDAAVLTGRMATNVRVDGTEKHLDNRVCEVWSAQSGTWQLVVFQSTPVIQA